MVVIGSGAAGLLTTTNTWTAAQIFTSSVTVSTSGFRSSGVPMAAPETVTGAINSFIKALNNTFGTAIKPIKSFGGLQHNEPLYHNKSDNPNGCAGYK